MKVTVYAPLGSADHQVFDNAAVPRVQDDGALVVITPHPNFSSTVFNPGEWSGFRVDRDDPPTSTLS